MKTWLLTKILNYLATYEGCTIDNQDSTDNSVYATIQDVFGYRYQVNIKLLGRTTDYMPLTEGIAYAKETNSLAILEDRTHANG